MCQDACPFNRKIVATSLAKEFCEASGVGRYLDIVEVLSLKVKEDFVRRFASTPIMRVTRERLIRNACCVAGNIGLKNAKPALINLLHNDHSDMVRNHAKWALERL